MIATEIERELYDLNKEEVRSLALSLDPVAFAQSLGFNPWPWQAEFLRDNHQRIIMNCPRGAGKSLLTGIIALHHAVFTPHAFVLMFSRSDRQAMELFKKARDYYKLGIDVPKADSAHGLELKNGSRILSLPSSPETVVGYHDVTLLIIDEAALAKEELYKRARPMLDHLKGRLFSLSTPLGKRGFYYDEWRDWEENPQTFWRGITVTTDECPHMTPEFLAEEREKLGERWYRQEYECSFEENADAYFTYDEVQGAISKDVKPLFS